LPTTAPNPVMHYAYLVFLIFGKVCRNEITLTAHLWLLEHTPTVVKATVLTWL